MVGFDFAGAKISAVKLKEGGRIDCAAVVNSAGYHARTIAGFAGIDLPVHPRKRYVYVFDCREEVENEAMPLTIDPSGVCSARRRELHLRRLAGRCGRSGLPGFRARLSSL